jgi:hypothetical protein
MPRTRSGAFCIYRPYPWLSSASPSDPPKKLMASSSSISCGAIYDSHNFALRTNGLTDTLEASQCITGKPNFDPPPNRLAGSACRGIEMHRECPPLSWRTARSPELKAQEWNTWSRLRFSGLSGSGGKLIMCTLGSEQRWSRADNGGIDSMWPQKEPRSTCTAGHVKRRI